jgi:glyoxylase-like metal-dependent hydrolase (beta-lactamase superfamily II)
MVKIYRISPKVYFRKADLATRGQCNSVFIDGGGCIALVDPSTVDAAKEIKEEVRLLFERPVAYIFLTHSHYDHAIGLPEFFDERVTTFCSHRCMEDILLKGQSAVVVGVRGKTYVSLDGMTIELITLEDTAHSCSDMLVRISDGKMLCTGDFVVDHQNMFFHDANPERWLANLREFESMSDKYILPGHGDVFPYSSIEDMANYLDTLIQAAKQCINSSPIGETPVNAAISRKVARERGANVPAGLLKGTDDTELGNLVTDYLKSGSNEAREIIEKVGERHAYRELLSITRNMRIHYIA